MATSGLFENSYNPYRKLVVFSAKTAEDLQAQIAAQNVPCQIISIYAMNGIHYAWLVGKFKIQRSK